MSNEESEPRGEYVPALVIESKVTPQQRARNYALFSRLFYGVPPEQRTGESREGIGLHVFVFAVPLEDVSIGMREISFRLKPESECLRRLCSYITDHFDIRCDADDEVERLRSRIAELEQDLNRERMALHRARTANQSADLVHIRLRDGLRRAIEAIDAHDQHAGVCDDTVMSDAELAELRRLVTP